MRTCTSCGSELRSENAKFCGNCGTPVVLEEEQPLLPETVVEPEPVPAPEPLPEVSKPKPKDNSRKPFRVKNKNIPKQLWGKYFKESIRLLFWLLCMEYLAVSAFCEGFEWPKHVQCASLSPWFESWATDGVACTTNAECRQLWDKSTCFTGWCVDNSIDKHMICYKQCTPRQMAVTWDITLCNILMAAFWGIGLYMIKRFDIQLMTELDEGVEWQNKMNSDEEKQGKYRAEMAKHSWAWNEELKGWQERKKRNNQAGNVGIAWRTKAFYLFYFCCGTIDMYCVILFSPKEDPPNMAPWGSWEALKQQANGFLNPQFDGYYEYMILTQFLLECVLFLIAVMTVRWPAPALVRTEGLTHKVNVNRVKGINAAREIFLDEDPGLIQNTCLLIACHQSSLNGDAKKTFTRTLAKAMEVFPVNAIFVCDNGPTMTPVCRTQEVCEELSLQKHPDGSKKINYLFIPEGNKSHAMYWTTEYWIPELVRRGLCEDFSFLIMIDDDVPLPPDLHVPLATLRRSPEVKGIAFVICAATEDGSQNALVDLQDAEYKLAGFVKQFQWNFGTTLCCHGAIGLWRRDILGKQILWNHDTVFHGEDLYMGLLLHRMQQNYAIMVSAGAVVPTFAPERMLILFRQRVTSWDLCAERKFMTYLKEFLRGWCWSTRTLILKPFLLEEVICVILDWVRPFLMIGLLHRNPVTFFMCFLVFYSLLYVEIFMFNFFVMRDRPDLRMNLKTCILFPFYRTLCLFFRLYALFRNALEYTPKRRKGKPISYREENVQDLPPVPPVASPNWWNIWIPNEVHDDDDELREFASDLVKPLSLDSATDRGRLHRVVQSYLLFLKLTTENGWVGFPDTLYAQGANAEADLLSNAYEKLRVHFDAKIAMFVGLQMESFQSRLGEKLQSWIDSGVNLFFHEDLVGSVDNEHIRDVVAANRSLMKKISELVHDTRYPRQHDKLAELKVALKDINNLLDLKFQALTTEQVHARINVELTSIIQSLEDWKQIVAEQNIEKLKQWPYEEQLIRAKLASIEDAGELHSIIKTVIAQITSSTHKILGTSPPEAAEE
eukprot:TRINITY_DN3597_c0_g1_i1.p1 TRINITY_DN3597_c0_g1~~TRINITY_DN3597_c0_g1_i1.p1  ORF type:complete len:1060 (+),score=333.46 TRINITY_DN3597_c0_g1_i1:210-3389(+)